MSNSSGGSSGLLSDKYANLCLKTCEKKPARGLFEINKYEDVNIKLEQSDPAISKWMYNDEKSLNT